MEEKQIIGGLPNSISFCEFVAYLFTFFRLFDGSLTALTFLMLW